MFFMYYSVLTLGICQYSFLELFSHVFFICTILYLPNEFLSFQSIYKWSITFLCIRSTNHKFLNGWEFPRPFFLPLKIRNCSTNVLISIYTPNLSVIACRCLHIISITDVNDKEGGGHLEELDSSPPPSKTPLSL